MRASLLSISPARAVWSVAWPMAALGLLRSLYFLTASFWVGRMGPKPLAALGAAAFAWWMIALACDLAAVGAHALVARHEGAGQRERIAPTMIEAGILGLGVAVLLAVVALPLTGHYFDLVGLVPGSEEHGLGRAYIDASILGASSLALYAVVGAAFRGLGQTRTALVITALTVLVNAALDPLLIWGAGPIPALGIAGAAWGTALANALGAVVGLAILAARGIRLRALLPRIAELLRIARIGLPVTATGIGFALCYVLLGRVITAFGSAQMGGLGVGHRLESIPYLLCVAFGVGAATMVGQHLGAGNPDRAAQAARAAARTCALVMVPVSVALFALAGPLLSIFTDDAATIDAGALYLRIQIAVLVPMALEEVYLGAFAGAGDTLAASVISFGWTVLRIPAAWFLAFETDLGISGVWIAIAASTAIKGLSLWFWWERGRWRTADGRKPALLSSEAERAGS